MTATRSPSCLSNPTGTTSKGSLAHKKPRTRTNTRSRNTSSIWSYPFILFTSKHHTQKRKEREKAESYQLEALKNHQSRKDFVDYFKSIHLYEGNEDLILNYYITCETNRLTEELASEAVESYTSRHKSSGRGSTSLQPSDFTDQAKRYTISEVSKQLENPLKECLRSIVESFEAQAKQSDIHLDPIETVQSGIFGLTPIFDPKNGLSALKSCTLVSGINRSEKDGEGSIIARKDRGRFEYCIFDDEIEDLIREGNRSKIIACPWPVG